MTAIRRGGASAQAYVPIGLRSTIPTQDPITKNLYRVGQINPKTEQEWLMQHGRYLAGLGGLNETQSAWDADYKDRYTRSLEKEDDVYGSGIFDTYGRDATVHPNMGVFADNPSIPGFIDREVLYKVSKEVSDLPSGADVVTVAGGGMTYQEKNRYPVPFDQSAPTPCPPVLMPPPPTMLDQVYAALTPQPMSGFGHVPQARGGAPLLPPPSYPGRAVYAAQNPGQKFSRMAKSPHQTVVGQAPLYMPGVYPEPVDGYRMQLLAEVPAQYPLAMRDISLTAQLPRRVPAPSLKGLGAADDAPGWGTYLLAGLIVGGSAAMFYGATKMKKAR